MRRSDADILGYRAELYTVIAVWIKYHPLHRCSHPLSVRGPFVATQHARWFQHSLSLHQEQPHPFGWAGNEQTRWKPLNCEPSSLSQLKIIMQFLLNSVVPLTAWSCAALVWLLSGSLGHFMMAWFGIVGPMWVWWTVLFQTKTSRPQGILVHKKEILSTFCFFVWKSWNT